MDMGGEGVMNRMNRLGKSLMMYDRVVTVEEVMERLLAVNPEDIHPFANELFNREQISLAAIGTEEALAAVENEFRRWWS